MNILNSNIIIVFLPLGIIVLFMSLRYWRLSVTCFFLWLLLEGIFRKWLLNDYASPLFFIKHLFLIGPFIRILTDVRYKITKSDYPFIFLIFLYIGWGIIEFLNFRVTESLIVKILGFVTHYWFISLIFIIPNYLKTDKKLIRFLILVTILSIPIYILGVVQYNAPINSEINRYVHEGVTIARVGSHARITTVFSFISPYNSYLSFVFLITIYLLVTIKKSTLIRSIILCSGLLASLNIFMTGSRALLVIVSLKLILFIAYLAKKKKFYNPKILLGFTLFVFISTFTIAFTTTGRDAYDSFKQRIVTTHDVSWRLSYNYNFGLFMSRAGVMGYGLGTTYQGAGSYISNYKDMPYFENENSKIILEMGIIGFMIIYILRVFLFIYTLSVILKTKIYERKLLVIMGLIIQVPTVLAYTNNIYNYMENIVYWFTIGLIIAINRMNKMDRQMFSKNNLNYNFNKHNIQLAARPHLT